MNPGEIYEGDAAKVLADFPDGCIDLTVTSPPYDSIRDYKGFDFDFNTIARELARVLKDGGVIVWNVCDQTINGSETGTSFRQALYFMDECGLRLHDTMIYHKTGVVFPETTRYAPCFEYMFLFSKGAPKTIELIKDKKNSTASMKQTVGTYREADGVLRRKERAPIKPYGVRENIWRIPPNLSKLTRDHPARMPENMAIDHIRSWSKEDDIVLDPFAGSGTTLAAAKKQNRRWIGIELSKEYCDLARKYVASVPTPLL